MDLNFTTTPIGFIIQSNSYIQITKSNFTNNTVTYGIIKVLSSSTLEMSDSIMERNQAVDCAGAIYAERSVIYITNTSFSNNEAVQEGGAFDVRAKCHVFIKNCTFSNNQAKFGNSSNGYGGAIKLVNSTLDGINMSFINNTASYVGGAVYFVMQCRVNMQHVHFSHSMAIAGSATYISDSSKFFCKNCSLYQNQNIGNYIDGTAFSIYSNSIINVSGFECRNHRGYFSSCICAMNNSSVLIYDGIFSMNIGSTISLLNNSYLIVINSSFFNNTTPDKGAAIHSQNSTLNISHSFFHHNKAKKTGISLLKFNSTAVFNNCTFINNSPTAVALFFNTMVTIVNCTYTNNSSPDFGAALMITKFL